MFPERLLDFASFGGQLETHFSNLAQLAEPEDWDYKFSESDKRLPVLHNYIVFTFRRLVEENKIAVTDDETYACFDTGLMTQTQEPIYAFFGKNRVPDKEEWYFIQWARRGEIALTKFAVLPDMAHYFENPDELVFHTDLEIRENADHIINENYDRFPEPYSRMERYLLQNLFRGALDSAKMRVRRNYKIAIPQYYQGRIQLLLPICLSNPLKADVALTVQRNEMFYRATTILTLDMAYNNARQIARPDRDWLQP